MSRSLVRGPALRSIWLDNEAQVAAKQRTIESSSAGVLAQGVDGAFMIQKSKPKFPKGAPAVA